MACVQEDKVCLLGLVGVIGVGWPWWPVLPGLEGGRLGRVGETSLALVVDLGHVAVVAVHEVLDVLQTGVGKPHVVGSLSVFAVTGFLVSEVVAGVFVLNGITEVVLGFS